MTHDESSLLDIAEAARSAREFATRVDGLAGFKRDRLVRCADLHELMILGETTKRSSAGFKESHPDVPWRAMAGTRDYLIHSYDGVDQEVAWDTVTVDVPDMLAQIEPLLPRR